MHVAKVDSLFDPTISLVIGVSFFLSIGFGSKFIVDGAMTIGDLVAFTTFLGLLIWPMLAIGMLFNIMERGAASYDRIESLLNFPVDIDDKFGAIDKRPQGDIHFDVREFAFPGDKTPALQDVQFILKRGETLGVVGKTGSGKTTILKLLLREFEGYDGEITYGGVAIDEYQKNGSLNIKTNAESIPEDILKKRKEKRILRSMRAKNEQS